MAQVGLDCYSLLVVHCMIRALERSLNLRAGLSPWLSTVFWNTLKTVVAGLPAAVPASPSLMGRSASGSVAHALHMYNVDIIRQVIFSINKCIRNADWCRLGFQNP